MKRLKLVVWAVLVVAMAFLAACNNSASNEAVDPKQLLTDAIKQSQEMESMAFEGQYVLSLDFENMMIDEEIKGFLDIFKDLTINYSGAYQKDLEKVELVLETQMNLGDLRSTVEVPLLIEGEKIWLKVPNLPGFIPDEFSGQYLEMDLKEIAEMSGEEYVPIFPENEEEEQAMTGLALEIIGVFIKNVDDSNFSVTSEEGTEVTVDFSGDRLYDIIENTVRHSLPELYEVLSKSEHLELLGLTQADLDELKELENEIPEDAFAELEELKDYIQINVGEMKVLLDEDGFIKQEGFSFDGTFSDPEIGEDIRISFDFTQSYSNVNGEQEFVLEAPGADVIDVAELFGTLMMGGMDYSDEFYDVEFERVDELQFELAQEEWFNRPEVSEIFFEDESTYELLFDEEFLEMLLYDEAGRDEWLSEYGVEL
ncbi:hypothetical protein [Halalkalibacter krulwichiae]|uniref:Lipoprotein n=1 Tax=Halalkalibacter krulwichiae TaxID=199441 RepID=A0A1X9MEK9_9BACI|nr:hypothetical protein [Halalkalibacter krulwichiae]ARK29971.1 hypothetical protein BkAM31D_08900 [Halalkalibacter krulwichiae]